MPLNDDYQVDKELTDFSKHVAEAITDSLIEIDKNKTWGFIFFLVDYETGTLNYISDMDREAAISAIKGYIKRSEI